MPESHSRRFVIRCDGSASLGMGHVVRSLSLATALRDARAQVKFAVADLGGLAQRLVGDSGFELVTTSRPADRDMRRSLRPDDLGVLVETAKTWNACVVIDHYGADANYFREVAGTGLRLGVIDDLADRDLSAAEWLLNQNPGAIQLSYRTKPACRKLLGLNYTLMRPQFRCQRERLEREFHVRDNRVLITLGGGETQAMVAAVLSGLSRVTRQLQIRCVLGGDSGQTMEVETTAARSVHTIEVQRNVENMAELMAWCDVSVNASGSTCWELCCLGVPMVTMVLSADQAANAAEVDRLGLGINVGEFAGAETAGRIAQCIEQLLADPQGRRETSSRAKSMVDCRGAERAAESLIGL